MKTALIALLLPLSLLASGEPSIDKLREAPTCRGRSGHLDRGGESGPGQSEWRARYYEIDGLLDFDAERMDGNLRAWLTPEETADSLVLDALWNMEIHSVLIDGAEADWFHDGSERLSISTQDIEVGIEHLIEVDYEAFENTDYFGAFVFASYEDEEVTHPIAYTMTETQYAGSWWPCIDRLDHKPDSVSLRITVPDTLVVASNGTLDELLDHGDGSRTYHWTERHPIATYLVSITVSNYLQPDLDGLPWTDWYHFEDGDSMPMTWFIWPRDEEGAATSLPWTHDMMDCFRARFGEYPFRDEKYGVAEYRFQGGMEHQTISSLGSWTITREDSIFHVSPHELAHQWFGDHVTCATWEDVWLNEGFATYSEALYYEHFGRWSPGDYLYERRHFDYFPVPVYTSEDPFSAPAAWSVYYKGAWVLHMLRGRLRHLFDEGGEDFAFGESRGDSLFYEVLESWAQDSPASAGTGTTEQFQSHAESLTGLDLESFFQNWVYGLGRPYYYYEWTCVEDWAGWRLDLRLQQVQNGSLFDEPLDLHLGFGSGENDTIITVLPDAESQLYSWTFAEEVTSLDLDPLHRILNHPIEGVIGDGPFSMQQSFPNPFSPSSPCRILLSMREELDLKLAIYDVSGRLVRLLHDKPTPPETYEFNWDGRDDRGNWQSYGVFLVVASTGNWMESRKVVFLPGR
ncbi:MAG: M1 family aminopeptidase [Candidatus Krumholzibacteria bacterium]|nr:M1 family aminopeptidase [Candidatus Krumholzibacteria bacterium]